VHKDEPQELPLSRGNGSCNKIWFFASYALKLRAFVKLRPKVLMPFGKGEEIACLASGRVASYRDCGEEKTANYAKALK
jgi:hypothetical protein